MAETEIVNLYDELQTMLKEDLAIPIEKEDYESDEGYSNVDYLKNRISKYLKTNYRMLLVGVIYAMVVLHFIYQVGCFLFAMYYVDAGFLVTNVLYILIWMTVPFIVWIFSTLYDYWNYHNRKMAGITFGIVNFGIIIAQFLYRLYCYLALPIFVNIPTSRDITENMVFNLTRFLFAIFAILPIVLFLKLALNNVYSVMTKRSLLKFKLGRKLCIYFKELYGLTDKLVEKYTDYKSNIELDKVRPFPFAIEVCKQITTLGGRNYILTHRGDSTLQFLQHYGMMSYFTEVITKKYGFKRKPDPEGFNYLIEKYKINRSEAMVVGDRECEIVGGKSVGIKTCLYNTNNISLTVVPDYCIDH